MCDSAVALCHIDILELYVHVVLRCMPLAGRPHLLFLSYSSSIAVPTFNELSAVSLPGIDFNRHLVTLQDNPSAVEPLVSACSPWALVWESHLQWLR